MKKLIALFLTFVMLATTVLGAVPVGAENSDASVETGNDNLTVEGTNGFGDLLSEDLLESQEEAENYEEGYTVTDIVIEGNTATVTYDSLEAANLVVALYTEDMVQMIMSANTVVDPESTTATVTFEGEMPQYFMAAAYLMDTYDMSPLCPMYDTPLYTKDMQDLLNSTVNDYDEELVLNLDESEETNFAVYAEDTVVVEEAQGVNTVASVDDENLTYVINNADDTVKELAKGDVFAYPYGEGEILIVKVDSIRVSGDTVTITGADLEMEDVFSHVKIEEYGTTEDATFDDSTADEGITYEGLVEKDTGARGGIDDPKNFYHKFPIKTQIKSNTNPKVMVEIGGSITLDIDTTVTFHLTPFRKQVVFKVSPVITTNIEVTGKIRVELKLPEGNLINVLCVKVGISPKLIIDFSGSFNYTSTSSFTIGLAYEDKKLVNLSQSPTYTDNLNIEGTFYIGIDLNPRVAIIDEDKISIGLTSLVGFEMTVSKNKWASTNDDSVIHTCKECYEYNTGFNLKLVGKIDFLNNPNFSIRVPVFTFPITSKIKYKSKDFNDSGDGECPRIMYKTLITVCDSQNQTKSGIKVTLSNGQSDVTNENGTVVFYIPMGSCFATVTVDSVTSSRQIIVDGKAQKVTINLNTEFNRPSDGNAIQNAGSDDKYSDVDYGTVTNSGMCGENTYWDLYDSGTLVISGYGDMTDYSSSSSRRAPWYNSRNSINRIVINNGITSIGDYAFYECYSLTSITIPDSVTTIGDYAFSVCESLTSITLPNSVTSLGVSAFSACVSLTNVEIPDSVTSLGVSVFFNCPSLTNIVIPDGVTSIDVCAFYYCDSLTSITIPDSVTSIDVYAFDGCLSLSTVYYGGSEVDWNNISIGIYNDKLFDAEIIFNSSYSSSDNEITIMSADVNDGLSVMSVYPGEYGSEITENYSLKTASFEGLAPLEDYILLILADMGAEDTLSSENLLYIGQGTALEDGTLTFKYVPKSNVDVSYVIACGPSNKDLKDATITFPEMEADGELAAVEPTVVYDGVTLTEGVDYVIVGTVDYSRGGTYTCYIRGIYDYTGVVTCTYTVKGNMLSGDLNGDGMVNAMDINIAKRILSGSVTPTPEQNLAGDINGDGSFNGVDSNRLVRIVSGQ